MGRARRAPWSLAVAAASLTACGGCSPAEPSDAGAGGTSVDSEGEESTAPDVGVDECADAKDLDAADFSEPDSDWVITTFEAALPLTDARSVTGGVVFSGELEELPDFPCLKTIDTLWIQKTKLADLRSFHALETVTEHLRIFNTTRLESLHGLESLDSVGGNIFINSNGALRSLEGLSSLRLAHQLTVTNCDELDNMHGMPAVTADSIIVGATVRDMTHLGRVNSPAISIYGAPVQSIEGFPLRPQMRAIVIDGGYLTSLAPLSEVEELSVLVIGAQQELETLDGLQNLKRLVSSGESPGKLELIGNPKLTDLTALSNLTEVENTLLVDNNESLVSLDGLHNVEHCENLAIMANLVLASLEPLLTGAMTTVDSLVMVTSNWALPQCQGEALCAKFPSAMCDVRNNDEKSTTGCG